MAAAATQASATAAAAAAAEAPARNPADIHFYYDAADSKSKASALAIRDAMQKAFPLLRFFNPHDKPIGPHPIAMWEADFGAVPTAQFHATFGGALHWLMLHHGTHSVLIHPHSSNGSVADHTVHALWLGDKQPLLIDRL